LFLWRTSVAVDDVGVVVDDVGVAVEGGGLMGGIVIIVVIVCVL